MRLYSSVRVLAFLAAAALFAPGAVAQDKGAEAKYKFKKGETLKFDVTSFLEVDQTGTHESFLTNGNPRPMAWTVNGSFENKVIDVAEDGTATLERHVKSVDSSGHVETAAGLEKFKIAWSKEKDKTAPDEAKYTSLMERFAVNMIANPVKYMVYSDGQLGDMADAFMKNLVMRRGMMTWPVRGSEVTWPSIEVIAVPMLHDKIKIEFKNQVTGDAGRSGFKVRQINAPATLKESASAGFHQFELKYTVSGGAKAEFDLTNGRLYKLEIDLKIGFSGEAPVGDGKGAIKGTATYKETQVYKD